MITGTMIITEPAAKTPRLLERSPSSIPYRPTAKVLVSLLVRKIEPSRNSESTPTRANRMVVARIGVRVGSRILVNTCQWEQPSMMAASSSSLGTVSKKPLISHTWPSEPPSSTMM